MNNKDLSAAKARIRQAKASLQLPPSQKTEGSALYPSQSRFAGKGWSGKFRTRPTTPFDLAAKIHDIHYDANNLSFFDILSIRASRHRSNSDEEYLSRAAKSDYLFSLMNAFEPPYTWSVKALNFSATLAFSGDNIKEFTRKKDGFINVLVDPDLSAELDDPTKYLMIPETQIPLLYAAGRRPDYSLKEADIDRQPGFMRWIKSFYSPIWDKVTAVTGAPLSELDIASQFPPSGSRGTRIKRCF